MSSTHRVGVTDRAEDIIIPLHVLKKNGEGECLAGSYWAEAKFWPIGPEAARPMMTLGNRNVLFIG